jgi:hypothetical protein
MGKVTIAIDVDDTLRQHQNHKGKPLADEDIRTLIRILHGMRNVRLVLWSGGGQAYAERVGRELHADQWIDGYASKVGAGFTPDLTIDDQVVTLGAVNLAWGTERVPVGYTCQTCGQPFTLYQTTPDPDPIILDCFDCLEKLKLERHWHPEDELLGDSL